MALYYRIPGLIARPALLANIGQLTRARLTMFHAFVLNHLPGIAGIILTAVVLAVDASVFGHYERLREELALGKSLKGCDWKLVTKRRLDSGSLTPTSLP